MQNRRSVEEVLAELRTWKQTNGFSYTQISAKTGVDLSTIYRLFDESEKRTRYGSGLKKICKIANIAIDGPDRTKQLPSVVRDAVLHTWDGSPEHAKLLAAAITALGALIRQAVSSR